MRTLPLIVLSLALLVPAGRIAIHWGVEPFNGQRVLKFTWQERDGPLVSPPRRKGFGHVLLEDVAQRFGSSVAMDFAQTGFRYELQADVTRLAPGPEAAEI